MDIQVPASHSRDPSSSHEAEARINKSGKRKRNQDKVLAMVKRNEGYTAAEIASRENPDKSEAEVKLIAMEIRRRCSDMNHIRVFQGAERRCDVAGTSAVVWYSK